MNPLISITESDDWPVTVPGPVSDACPDRDSAADRSAGFHLCLLVAGNAAVVSDVKSAHSLRTIDLDARTVAVLRSWRKRQLETYLRTGVRTDDSGFVFAKPDGSPLHPDHYSQAFERLISKMGLPRIRLHDMRHTHATLLLKAGVPIKVVSERLGHASVAFTMQVYQHVLPGMQAEAAATFGEIVFGS